MAQTLQKFAVLGSGAWGTALAIALARAGRDVMLWSRDESIAQKMQSARRHPVYFSNVILADSITITSDLQSCRGDATILAIPSQSIRDLCQSLILQPKAPVIVAAKGIELSSHIPLCDVVQQTLPHNPTVILSGPNFADEVAMGLPAATAIACKDETLGKQLLEAIGSPSFRPYYTSDMIGVCLGGSLKNVMAIAAGAVSGLQLGDNARAALVSRGLAEIMRLALALGAKTETLMGLSGVGDLMLTCYGQKSRNFRFGVLLGQGKTATQALTEIHSTVEGIATAHATIAMAEKYKIDIPIIRSVSAVLHEKLSVSDSMQLLLNRPFKSE